MSGLDATPGPWFVHDWYLDTIKAVDGTTIAVADNKRYEANARLIAAAPALYEALAETTARCAQYADYIRNVASADDLECHPYLPQLDSEVADGLAALKQARGEQ